MQATRSLSRTVLASAILSALAMGAAAASLGGGYWPAVGPGRISVKQAGIKPIDILGNLRFDFSGASSDLSGSASVAAYDALGQALLAEFPATWTTGNGASFRLDLAGAGFEEFVAARIEAATGKSASVTLTSAKGKGSLDRSGEDLRVSVTAAGEVSLDEGPPRRLRVTMRLK